MAMLCGFLSSTRQYQKLGKLYHVDEVEVHGPRDLSLSLEDNVVVAVGLVEAVAGQENQELPKERGNYLFILHPLTTYVCGKVDNLCSKGLMRLKDGELKPVRGTVLPILVQPGSDAEQLQKAAEYKMKTFHKNYKVSVGKAYQRITLYSCTAEDFHTYFQETTSESDESEVIIMSRSAAEFSSADTVVQ
ncbi:uncharacterized protein LOC117532600 [Scomber scombrus]|uniref:Uncharacterized protein LOC117532600 n=1 Tax=Scomber scombrus TaxID=13677 RepID=A0AAV1Q371_SCOSC